MQPHRGMTLLWRYAAHFARARVCRIVNDGACCRRGAMLARPCSCCARTGTWRRKLLRWLPRHAPEFSSIQRRSHVFALLQLSAKLRLCTPRPPFLASIQHTAAIQHAPCGCVLNLPAIAHDLGCTVRASCCEQRWCRLMQQHATAAPPLLLSCFKGSAYTVAALLPSIKLFVRSTHPQASHARRRRASHHGAFFSSACPARCLCCRRSSAS